MQKGNVNGSLKISNNNMSSGIPPLTDETFQLLKLKYPDVKDTSQQALLQGPKKKCIQLRMMTVMGGKGSFFGTATSDLHEAIAELFNKLCITNI